MKRSVLLLFFVPLFTMAFSQITIRRADYTVSGIVVDTTISRGISILNLAIPQRGGNRIWDYTAIKDTLPTVARVVNSPVAASLLPTGFKDATFTSFPRPAFGTYSIVDTQYRTLDTTGLYILGNKRGSIVVNIAAQTGGSTDSLFILSRINRYTTPPYLVKLPMTSTTFSKIQTVDTLSYLLSWASAGYTRADVKFIRRSEHTTEVVGWGTLRLRNSVVGGPILNYLVLFERYAELRLDSFYLNNSQMPKRVLDSFRIIQGKRDTVSMVYSLRGLGVKQGILRFNMSNDEAYIITATRIIEPTLGLISGSQDLASYDVPLTVFPNPVTEGVNIAFDKKTSGTWHAMIYNETGQMIDVQSINAPQGGVTHRITLNKSLPSGHYFINILDESSLIRSNGRFVKM